MCCHCCVGKASLVHWTYLYPFFKLKVKHLNWIQVRLSVVTSNSIKSVRQAYECKRSTRIFHSRNRGPFVGFKAIPFAWVENDVRRVDTSTGINIAIKTQCKSKLVSGIVHWTESLDLESVFAKFILGEVFHSWEGIASINIHFIIVSNHPKTTQRLIQFERTFPYTFGCEIKLKYFVGSFSIQVLSS